MNWEIQPYDHFQRKWEKKYDSIMNPGSKVTWPQFIAEMVVYFRSRVLDNYKDVKIGPNWYKSITSHVRQLNYQSVSICNYFPHPDDEPLIIVAFRNWFRKMRPLSIGGYRKNRVSDKNGRKSITITQNEKDLVLGITEELDRLVKQRNIFAQTHEKMKDEIIKQDSFRTSNKTTGNKNSLTTLLEMEKKLNG